MEDKLNYLFKFISYASYEKLINSKNKYLLELLVNNSRNVNLNCLYLIRYGVSDIEKVILTKTEDITKDHDEFIKDIKSLEKEVNEAAPFIRGKLSEKLEIRHTPELKFVFDKSIAYGEKIEAIIKSIDKGE